MRLVLTVLDDERIKLRSREYTLHANRARVPDEHERANAHRAGHGRRQYGGQRHAIAERGPRA